jgi:tetratricopeptide (TPR) repeat protein
LALQQLGEFGQKLDHLRATETLAETLRDQRRLGRIYSAMTNTLWVMGDGAYAPAYGQRALALAAILGDVRLQAEAHFHLGQVYYGLGDYRQAMDLLRRNVVSLQGELLQERTGTPGPTAAFSRARLVWCLAEVGEFPEGRVRGAEAIHIAEASDYPYGLVATHFAVGYLYLRQGALPQAIRMFERCVVLSQDLHLPAWFPTSVLILGYSFALVGRVADAVRLLEQAREHAAAGRTITFHSATIAWQSEAALLVGHLDDALTCAEQAPAVYRERQERGHEAYALRLLGEIAARREPPECDQAEVHYLQALALAEELGMRPLQAHCHRDLGTLYAATGQREQARTALSTAIEMYRAMEMTFWLPQTEAALAQVEGR